MNKLTSVILAALLLLGCAANNSEANRLTLGTVQKTVYEGANQTEIMEALGAPNIITNNSSGREVWTYDRISREAQASSSVVVTWWNPISWLAGIASGSSSRSSTTSKSITVLITFDDNKRVADFKYQRLEF
jgi:outer membrane protein assembly factor BamE (lipoprotein component of BamABCDE complex)